MWFSEVWDDENTFLNQIVCVSLNCPARSYGFNLGFLLSSFGFVDKTPNKLSHVETHIHSPPWKEELERRRRTNGSEGLGLLNFLDFLSTMGHIGATTFWNKGGR